MIKMKKIWVNKTGLFNQANKFDTIYYFRMSKASRIETMQFLREAYYKMKPGIRNESRKGLRRAIRVIQ